MKQFHVYGIGNALVDNDYEVSESLLTQFNIIKNSHELIDDAHRQRLQQALESTTCTRNCGGSAGNTIMTITQFGGQCYYSCRLGDDVNGEFYRDELNKHGIGHPYQEQPLANGHTGTCFVLVTPDGDRSLQTHLGITETLSTHEVDSQALKRADFVYIEGFIAAQPSAHRAALQCRHLAKQHQVKIAITLSDVFMTTHFRQELAQLVEPGVDLLFCNEAEALSYTNETNVYNALEKLHRYSKQVVITRGEHGSLVSDGKQTLEIAAVATSVVDTVGAGDMYAGTFLYAICHHYPLEIAANMASYAAAKIISKFTARFNDQEFQQLVNEIEAQFNLEIAE